MFRKSLGTCLVVLSLPWLTLSAPTPAHARSATSSTAEPAAPGDQLRSEPCARHPAFEERLSDDAVDVTIYWDRLKGTTTLRVGADRQHRVRQGVPVNVTVRNFNFLHYSLRDEVSQEEVETYRLLELLFRQSIGLVNLVTREAHPARDHDFGGEYIKWLLDLAQASRLLEGFLGRYSTKVSITAQDAEKIRRALAREPDQGGGLEACGKNGDCNFIKVRDDLRAASQTVEEKAREASDPAVADLYLSALAVQDALFTRIETASSLGSRTASGVTRTYRNDKAGFVRTVVLEPVDRGGNVVGPGVAMTYFVHSKLPVNFHLGAGLSRLKDIEFERVRTAAGGDLYDQVRDEDFTVDLSAFLTYEILTLGSTKPWLFGFTLGTDFSKPGARIYAGFSTEWNRRVWLTGGLVAGLEDEGRNPLVEDLGAEMGSRELFTTIDRARKFRPFVAVSLSVF